MDKQDEFFRYIEMGVDELNASKRSKISQSRLLELKKNPKFMELLDCSSAKFTCDMMGGVSRSLVDPIIAIKALQMANAQKEKDFEMTEDPLADIFRMDVNDNKR